MSLRPDRNGIVHIGSARGKIALYLDKDDALREAERLWPGDAGRAELLEAIAAAYPETEDEAPTLVGIGSAG